MSIIRPIISNVQLKNHVVLFTAVRNHWNKDYKPTPYPKSFEERVASAKKYGLNPMEYEPYPDDGAGYGDYPKLPLESGDSKDPNYPWDNPELKRNFNEPLNANAEIIGEDRYDVNARHRVALWKQFAQFGGVIFTTFAIYLYCENFKWFAALAEKQYPKPGVTHYTFDLEE